ncbi:hypothetical protein [Glaciibacter psychrotolerans]|uniref:Uncharacterized protein n=1 Tax=Glaciibacter psychrotolerans TaxID=670054 RepID=A0A7Z0EFY7_9MICO|nr:hypothetical protein [Leifsonia psychrotolerans]NYJ20803.1 hypothetical protein [Leifsonia psychrotolerans]
MTNTIDQALDYARAHPTRDGKSWAGWCESLIWRAGGFTRSFASAQLAGDASGWLNPDWTTAPRGALHYWSGVGGDGHVAFDLGGGTLLMASSRVSSLGTALGLIHFLDYKLPEYRGWSLRHGTETLARSATAGAGTTPLEDDMTPVQEKMLAEVHWMLSERVRPQLNALHDGTGGAVHKKLDVVVWALTDPKAGLRKMLGDLITKLIPSWNGHPVMPTAPKPGPPAS